MRYFLIVNPGSGTDSPTAAELRDAAAARGVEVRFLEDGDDLQELARSAGADVLGMAGGDGSLAAVADGRDRAGRAVRLHPLRDAEPLRA